MRKYDPNLDKFRLKGVYQPNGNNGAWEFPYPSGTLRVIASDGTDWAKTGMPLPAWEHVSVSTQNRCPTWDEMCRVKDLFWGSHELVIQMHPPRHLYVNHHPFCLHLWKPIGVDVPIPPKETLA